MIAGRIIDHSFQGGHASGALVAPLDHPRRFRRSEAELHQAEAKRLPRRAKQSARGPSCFSPQDRKAGAPRTKLRAISAVAKRRHGAGQGPYPEGPRSRRPFAGIVGLRQVSVGEYITPGPSLGRPRRPSTRSRSTSRFPEKISANGFTPASRSRIKVDGLSERGPSRARCMPSIRGWTSKAAPSSYAPRVPQRRSESSGLGSSPA